MSQAHPLDTIIKEVNKSEASSQAKTKTLGKKVIVINKVKKEIMPKIPFFSGKNVAYYLVANNEDAANIAERKDLLIEVRDFANDRKLGISVAYRASCPAGNEEKVTEVLCGDNSPGVELDKKVKTWMIELTDEYAAKIIDDYPNQVKEIQKSLKRFAQEKVGLKLDFRLSLDKEEKLESVQIGPTEITVYVSDSDEALDLQLKTELIVNDLVIATSNLESGWLISLVKLTKEEIKKYLLKNITISQFYYELKDTVRNRLANHLDSVLRDKGRKVGYLYLDSKTISSSPVPKELVEIQDTVDCQVQRYADLVSVENTLLMLPQDVRRYISAQSPNLKAWVKNKLEKIVKPLLLDKKYVDILLDFEKEALEIKSAMQAEAESIGYAVQHIVSLPKLEHLILKENLEIKDNNNKEFSTNAASIKVKLSTTANIKFENFEKLEDYLVKTNEDNQLVSRPVKEIKDLISETINSTMGEILRTVSPERFYMGFYEPITDEKSVEQELKDAITKALEERFGAKVIRVVPIPEQTDIIDYLQRLMGMIGSFECEVPSLTGGETVKFQGDFKILAIEQGSWYIFQSAFQSMRESQQELLQELQALKEQYSRIIRLDGVEDNREDLDEISLRIRTIENEIFGMDDIKRSIEKSVNAKLTVVDSELFGSTDIKLLSTMERYINQWARESVIEQYGLEINIRNLSRIRTQQEAYLYEAQKQLEKAKVDEALAKVEAIKEQNLKELEINSIRNQAKVDQLKKLYEQKAKILLDPDSDEIKNLNEQINNLEKEVSSFSLEDVGNSLKILKPKIDKNDNILSFEKQMDLPTSPNSSDSSSDNDTITPNKKNEII